MYMSYVYKNRFDKITFVRSVHLCLYIHILVLFYKQFHPSSTDLELHCYHHHTRDLPNKLLYDQPVKRQRQSLSMRAVEPPKKGLAELVGFGEFG